MTVKVSFEFGTATEAASFLRAVDSMTIVSTTQPEVEAEKPKAKAKGKPGPKPKAKPAETIEEVVQETKEDLASTAKVSVDDVRAALNKVGAKLGVQECVGIVKSFGAKRVNELDPGKYADVVTACEAKLA